MLITVNIGEKEGLNARMPLEAHVNNASQR